MEGERREGCSSVNSHSFVCQRLEKSVYEFLLGIGIDINVRRIIIAGFVGIKIKTISPDIIHPFFVDSETNFIGDQVGY